MVLMCVYGSGAQFTLVGVVWAYLGAPKGHMPSPGSDLCLLGVFTASVNDFGVTAVNAWLAHFSHSPTRGCSCRQVGMYGADKERGPGESWTL